MPLRNTPIKRKLMTVNLLTSGTVLLLTCAAFITYEVITLHKNMVQGYLVRAQIIAANSTASLAFDNADDATDVLAALKSDRRMKVACIYDAQGEMFAKFPTNAPASAFPTSPGVSGYRGGHLDVFCPVMQGDRTLGIVYIQSDLSALTDRYRAYFWLTAIILAGSIFVAYVLSRALQRQISHPILALAETAKAISDHRDFSVRAPKTGNDELGLLTGAFNQLLASIEERGKALSAANETLRGEISERKNAEDKVQSQLARMELLHRITRAIGERQDLKSIFHVVIKNLEDHLPVDFACALVYDQASTLTVAAAGQRALELAPKLGLTENTSVPVDQNGLARSINGHLVFEPDTSQIKHTLPQKMAGAGLHSLVMAPLLVESQVFGVLLVARKNIEGFSSGECEFLRQLSEHTALAAHQAQLHDAIQRAYDDLRQTQQTVLQQERLRALGQMASGIAHDINNALSPMSLYTEWLLENEKNLSTRAREYLGVMQHAVDDVGATVGRMREFYRQREPQLTLVPVALNDLAKQVVELSRARWHDIPLQRGIVIKLVTDLAPDLPETMGIESEIREALVNLVFNAADAMPDGGTLTLRTRLVTRETAAAGAEARKVVQIEVGDTGVGMDEETRRRCLEPFFTTKGERGTGLGLAMVYGIIQRHSAELEIDSAVGKGTTVRLGFSTPTGVSRGAAERPGSPRGTVPRMRILIVDDDPLLINSLRDALETDGHIVTAANGGQAGIDAFRTSRQKGELYGAVITDLGMPYIDGRKVAASVKAMSPSTPVIMLTGWGRRIIAEHDIPPHVDQVLNKPPKMVDIRDALARLCGSGEAEDKAKG